MLTTIPPTLVPSRNIYEQTNWRSTCNVLDPAGYESFRSLLWFADSNQEKLRQQKGTQCNNNLRQGFIFVSYDFSKPTILIASDRGTCFRGFSCVRVFLMHCSNDDSRLRAIWVRVSMPAAWLVASHRAEVPHRHTNGWTGAQTNFSWSVRWTRSTQERTI